MDLIYRFIIKVKIKKELNRLNNYRINKYGNEKYNVEYYKDVNGKEKANVLKVTEDGKKSVFLTNKTAKELFRLFEDVNYYLSIDE